MAKGRGGGGSRPGGKTGDYVRGFREVLGNYGSLSRQTGISQQRLQAIAESRGRPPDRSEISRISAFARRGPTSGALSEAASNRNISSQLVYQQAKDVSTGQFKPIDRLNLLELSKATGVPFTDIQHVSLEGIKSRNEARRGITEAFVTSDRQLLAYGADGKLYAGYRITSKNTGASTLYWTSPDSLANVTAAEFARRYELKRDEVEIDLYFDEEDLDL